MKPQNASSSNPEHPAITFTIFERFPQVIFLSVLRLLSTLHTATSQRVIGIYLAKDGPIYRQTQLCWERKSAEQKSRKYDKKLSTLLLCFSLVGCSTDPSEQTSPDISKTASQNETDTPTETSAPENPAPENGEAVSTFNEKSRNDGDNQTQQSAGTATASDFELHCEWELNPNKSVPNCGTILISVPMKHLNEVENGRVHVEVTSSNESWSISKKFSELKYSHTDRRTKQFKIPIFGLRPDEKYQVQTSIQLSNEQQKRKSSSFDIRTKPVSPLFPNFHVRHSNQKLMEPGLTLFNLIRWENNKPDTDFGAIVALDSEGTVRWSYQSPHLIFIVRKLKYGNLLYGYGNRTDGLIEIDLFGNLIRQWNASNLGRNVPDDAIPVSVDSLHHDVQKLEDGNFIALATSLHEMKPYYDPSYNSRKRIPKANLVADVVVEFQPDGKVLKRYPLFELLDPRRIGYGSLHNFWDSRGYETVEGGTYDWSHSNSLTYDARDNSVLVSVRHQDAVIKIDRTTGDLVWILGTPQNWKGRHSRKLLKPIGRPNWQYHQHAVELTPQGTLLLFDNGNYKATPFSKQVPARENFSRVVEFRVDEEKQTVEQVWEYQAKEQGGFYSTFLCDVDWLPETGNILITNGGEIRDSQGEKTDAAPGDQQWAEIFEVTYGSNPTRVFDLQIHSPQNQPAIGWSVYRGERIRDLFEKEASKKANSN